MPLPVLTEDPDPILSYKPWLLNTPAAPTTALYGQVWISNSMMGGGFIVSVNSSVLADRELFGDTNNGNYGNVTFTLGDAPGPVVITPSPPQMGNLNILAGTDKTWNDIVTAFNAWAVANLSPGVAPICSLSSPSSDGGLPLDQYQGSAYLNGNGAYEAMYFKVKSCFGDTVFGGELGPL